MGRRLASCGDPDFARYLRRAFIKAMDYSDSYQRLILLTHMTGINLAFGQARLATWYRYHEPIATTSKSQSNPACGGRKSPTGRRCSACPMPSIALRKAPGR